MCECASLREPADELTSRRDVLTTGSYGARDGMYDNYSGEFNLQVLNSSILRLREKTVCLLNINKRPTYCTRVVRLKLELQLKGCSHKYPVIAFFGG